MNEKSETMVSETRGSTTLELLQLAVNRFAVDYAKIDKDDDGRIKSINFNSQGLKHSFEALDLGTRLLMCELDLKKKTSDDSVSSADSDS